jgi:DNA polymerase-1
MQGIMSKIGRNPSAPTDLQALLLEELNLPVVAETPGGKPSFNRAAMEKYDILLSDLGSDLARDILIYRGWTKAISSSYENYLKYVSADGRVRPNYKIHGTVTGRLSCEKPNLQQIPRASQHDWDGGLKAAFIPADDWELWDFDYKNLELRLGAAYAGEEGLRNIFAAGRDVFSEMAAELGFSRQDTKTLVYTMQFGGGRQRIADVFGVTLAEAEVIRDRFFQRYPGMFVAMKKAERTANKNSKVKLWSGRYRHFNGSDQTYKAFNAAIQGGAADIVKRQIVRVHSSLDPDEARILLTVHDSIVVEIRKDRVEVLAPKIKEIMETIIPDFGVRFEVDYKKWGE